MEYDADVYDAKTYRAIIRPTAMAQCRAKELRSALTEPERMLVWAMKTTPRAGFRFRVQEPLGAYIADFYCHPARLVVEIDGQDHQGDRIERDRVRDGWMAECGIDVMRVHAAEVYTNLSSVHRSMIERARVRIELLRF